jgi:hypothetical protein
MAGGRGYNIALWGQGGGGYVKLRVAGGWWLLDTSCDCDVYGVY